MERERRETRGTKSREREESERKESEKTGSRERERD